MVSEETTLAYVWSFRDTTDNTIPYRISRKGRPKREGGTGAKLLCTCPSFINRGKRTCKHIVLLRAGSKDKSILQDEHYQITDEGKVILKLKEE